jgi:hypothetical protein
MNLFLTWAKVGIMILYVVFDYIILPILEFKPKIICYWSILMQVKKTQNQDFQQMVKRGEPEGEKPNQTKNKIVRQI